MLLLQKLETPSIETVTNSMNKYFQNTVCVFFFEFNWKYTSFSGESCYTPSNQQGTCVYLQQCPYLVQIYGYNPRSNEVINYLLGSQRNCGNRSFNRNPIVCTDAISQDIQSKITRTSVHLTKNPYANRVNFCSLLCVWCPPLIRYAATNRFIPQMNHRRLQLRRKRPQQLQRLHRTRRHLLVILHAKMRRRALVQMAETASAEVFVNVRPYWVSSWCVPWIPITCITSKTQMQFADTCSHL